MTSIQSQGKFELVADALSGLPIYQDRNSRGHNMYSSALNKYAEYLKEGFDTDIETDVESIFLQMDLSDTEKAHLIKVRIGQGGFRQKLIELWGGCAVTGYKDSAMLVASHIKPWRVSSNIERLDPFNGLLLLPTLDRAFDSGFITFDEEGGLMMSRLLENPLLLGVAGGMRVKLRQKHLAYMKFHREKVFRAT